MMKNPPKPFTTLLVISAFLFIPVFSELVVSDSPQPKILLVRDAHHSYIGVSNPNEVYGSYYEDALKDNNLEYDICTVNGKGDSGPLYEGSRSEGGCQEEDINGMKTYDMVIWFTGDDYGGSSGTTLTSADQDELETYLNNGGKLFISGQDIGYDIGATDFYADYLHSSYEADDYDECDDLSGDVEGISNDPISDGLLINIYGGAENQYYPSIVESADTYASEVFDYGEKSRYVGWGLCWKDSDSYYGAVRSDTGGPSGYKLAYLAFGFEGIEGSDKRAKVMNRVFHYLTGPKTKNTKVYPRGLDNQSYVDLNVSCDPADDYCLREMDPKINATCRNYQLFANVDGAEYMTPKETSSLEASDGNFDEDVEVVKNQVDIGGSNYLASGDESKEFKFSVRCQDTDSYWGRYSNFTYNFDRRRPSVGYINLSRNYTKSEKPNVDINLDFPDVHPAHFMRFSCNKTNWTSWRAYSSSYSNFNITNPQAGCDASDGNRTIYLQTRDRAGNLRNYTGYSEDWIVLDREAPKINSILPGNNSYLSLDDDLTVNFHDPKASDGSHSGVAINRSYNGTDWIYFTNNTAFDPGWSSEGQKDLQVQVNDSLGNLNQSNYRFKVDLTPPTTQDNSTGEWTNQNQTIGLSCSDPELADGTSGSGCNVTLYCVDSSGSCVPNQVYSPIDVGCAQGQSCTKYVAYYSNDTVNNTESTEISTNISIDKKAPEVGINSPASDYHRDSITINATVVEGNLSVDKVLYNITNSSGEVYSNQLSQSGNNWLGSYDTNNIGDGKYNITILANDTLGNLNNTQRVNISVDNTPPSTSDNITGAWRNLNKTVNLTCSDNGVGCDTILYCIDSSGTCTPNQEYTSPFNITCPEGSTCERYVRYKSNDTLGNTESIKTSKKIKIDKQEPDIQIDNPTGGTYSGVIDLKTTITDSGIGVNKSWYQVLNALNFSQVYDSGTLAGDYDTTWNSSENISTSGEAMFNVSANDSLANTNRNISVTFQVNNQKPSVVINYPDNIYLNSSFDLNLTAEKTGFNISYAAYNISNSTWNETNSAAGINESSYSFTDHMDISNWSDGNYTLNFTANDTDSKWGQDYSWFVLDRVPPETNDTGYDDSWNSTDQIVNLTCYPGSGVNASCDTTLHGINSTTDSNYTLNKTSTLFEVSCPEGETCQKQVVFKSNDTTGNPEDLQVSSLIKIDKEAPNTTDNTTGKWYKTNQSAKLNSTDKGAGNDTTLYCVDTSGTCTPSQEYNSPFEVGCSSNSVCEKYVRYKSNDTLGNLENTKTSKKVKVDKSPPSTSDNTSSEEPWYSKNQSVGLACEDQGSGCDTTLYCVNSTEDTTCNFKEYDNTGKISVGCVDGQACQKQVVYRSNDSAGNTEGNKTSYLIKIDKEPPHTWDYRTNLTLDENFNDTRIYPGDSLKFSVNISDQRNISYAKANLTGQIEKTLTRESGNVWNGTWSFTYSPSGLGFYTVRNITVNDSLGNEKIVSGAEIDKNFTVVNATLGIKLGSGSPVNAGANKTFNLTFDFNKTFSSPNLTLYIPPNSPGSLNRTPRYTNTTPYSSSCDIDTFNGNQTTPIGLNLSCGKTTEFGVTADVEAATPAKDTNDTWVMEFYGSDYGNTTHIITPFLNISEITCDGSCEVNQSQAFDMNVTVDNIQNSDHTANSTTTLRINSTFGENTSTKNITSGQNETFSFTYNLTTVGNYTFSFRVWDSTGQYNDTDERVVEVKDTEPPEFLDSYWEEDNIFNRNRTVSYRVKAKDNSRISDVWLTIEKGAYKQNTTLSLKTRYDEYDIWKLGYENDTTGTYNITRAYINDTEDNLNYTQLNTTFQIKKLDMNGSLTNELNINQPQVLFSNITGNASTVSSVSASIQKPRNFSETVNLNYDKKIGSKLGFNGTYSNVTRSGNYTASLTAMLESGVNTTTPLNFSVPWGNASVNVTENHLFLPKNSTFNLTWFIFPVDGDLNNVSGTFRINGTGKEALLNITGNNFTKNYNNITWESYSYSGFKAVWEVNTSGSVGQTNVTFSVDPSRGGSANKTILVNVTPEDTDKPDILSVSHKWEKLNLMETNTINVNATDNTTVVDEVLVEMTYPDSSSKNLSASLGAGGNWTLDFGNTNETGNFSYRVIAYDAAGNSTNTTKKTFNVTDEYKSVTITHNPYNKGDNITFRVNVTDVNDNPVKNFNLTLTLDTTSGTRTVVNNSITNVGSYEIQVSDSPDSKEKQENTINYTVYTNISKYGNTAGKTKKVTVSEELPTDIKSPDDGEYFKTGEYIPVEAKVTDYHGDLVEDAAVTAYCNYCDQNYERIEWNSSRQTYYDPRAFKAPDRDFSLDVYSVDYWKNKGYLGMNLKHGSPPSPTPGTDSGSTGGGGGAGGGMPSPEIDVLGPQGTLPSNTTQTVLKVRTGEIGECEYSSRDFEYGKGKPFGYSNGTLHTAKLDVSSGKNYYYKVKCKAGGVVGEDSTAFSVSQKKIEGFEATVKPVEISQGRDKEVMVELYNSGNSELTVHAKAKSDCCDISLPDEIGITAKSKKMVAVDIHVPLTLEPKEYTSFLTFSHEDIVVEKTLDIDVRKNRFISDYENINSTIEDLEKSINDYKEAGVETKELEKSLSDLKGQMENASTYLHQDNLKKFSQAVTEAREKKNWIETGLATLGIKKFLYENKWNILILIVAVFLSSYFAATLIAPYFRLRKELRSLNQKEKSLVDSRKAAEIQYFKRQIDEQTFRSLMTKKQDQILKTRSNRKKVKGQISDLLSSALNPKRVLEFPYEVLKSLGKAGEEEEQEKRSIKTRIKGFFSREPGKPPEKPAGEKKPKIKIPSPPEIKTGRISERVRDVADKVFEKFENLKNKFKGFSIRVLKKLPERTETPKKPSEGKLPEKPDLSGVAEDPAKFLGKEVVFKCKIEKLMEFSSGDIWYELKDGKDSIFGVSTRKLSGEKIIKGKVKKSKKNYYIEVQ